MSHSRVGAAASAAVPDPAWVAFLQWALPRMGLRWAGYARVRRQVIHRIRRRIAALGLPDLAVYRARLEARPEEWAVLDGLCRVTISRFYRDRGVWERLAREVLPALAARAERSAGAVLRAWSAGCASGEEPYTLTILWRRSLAPAFPRVALDVLATDADPALLARAGAAVYPGSALKDLPGPWRRAAFTPAGTRFQLRPVYRQGVTLRRHDVRAGAPDGPFHLVLCRNLAFTYFAPAVQEAVARHLAAALVPGGVLAVGGHERLPPGTPLIPLDPRRGLYLCPDGT